MGNPTQLPAVQAAWEFFVDLVDISVIYQRKTLGLIEMTQGEYKMVKKVYKLPD